MKKIFPVFCIMLIFLSGCKIKEYTPVIPETFKNDVTVYTGDFSFTCEICKTEQSVAALVTNTAAKGMTMTYDGNRLLFAYDDFSYDIDGSRFEKNNAAIVVFEVFDYISKTDQLNAKKIDGGYRYDGKISIGNFTMLQNDDNSLKSIEVKECGYKIEFAQ